MKLGKIYIMKKYLYIIKTQIIKSMTYEFNVYGNIIMQTIIMITSAYFWRALYTGRSVVDGVNIGMISVTYRNCVKES